MRLRKPLIACLLLAAVVTGAVYFYKSAYCVPILMYHSVAREPDRNNRLAVSTESFERQMRFLRAMRYNVIPLTELAGMLSRKEKVPARTVAVTFDDGYRDNYSQAFPILKKYRIPVTLFVITQEIGRPQQDRLSWEEIKEMQASGLVAIGSHCLGPEPLTKIASLDRVRSEIFDSKRLLEERLGTPVKAFSYPEGRFDETIKQLVVLAGYSVAVATNPGRRFKNDDVFSLKRLRVSSTSDNLFVFWIETSGIYTFIKEHRHK